MLLKTSIMATKNHVSQKLPGETVILNLKNRTYYGLTGVGPQIWESLKDVTTVEQVVSAIIRQYEVPPADCESDVVEIIQRLVDEGLVKVVNEDPQ
jgi:hypothetical protein